MKQYSPVVRLMSLFFLSVLALASCKKVNVATELGADLIPVVDNINTFDTTLVVQSLNFQTAIQQDSSRSIASDVHFLGSIGNDPLFGKTEGTIFLQLKPAAIRKPFAFTNVNDLITLDSVVLVMNYRTLYGDSTLPQQVQVFEVDRSTPFKADSVYLIGSNNFSYATPLSAPKTFLPAALNDSVFSFRERASNQLRIRLDDNFGNRLLRYDSSNAYLSDSAFNLNVKGLAVAPVGNSGGNALMGFNLLDSNTKLAIYYKYNNAGKTDTAVSNFKFTQGSSASANYIKRDYANSEFAAVAGDNVPDPLVYIQNTPGTFARLLIPGLAALTNRVVHRAELIVQQVKDPLATIFAPPSALYLDGFDAAAGVYRTIPFDVTFGQTGQINAPLFGMIPVNTTDPAGNAIVQWRFNLSRYVQHVANKTATPYEFRLYSPYITRSNIGTSTTVQSFQVNPIFGAGRVRVGGGSHPTQPMRLRIVYSKL